LKSLKNPSFYLFLCILSLLFLINNGCKLFRCNFTIDDSLFVSVFLQDFVFGDFSEQEAETLFDHDKQGVKVTHTHRIIHQTKTIFSFCSFHGQLTIV